MFDKYQSALKELPGAWDNSTSAVVAASLATKTITEELEKQKLLAEEAEAEKERAAAKERKRLDDIRNQQKKRIDDAKQAAKQVAQTLVNGAARLAEVFSIAGIASAVLGGFGLGRLASDVTDRSRAAAGVGVSYGQRAAFGAEMRPFLASPEGMLQNISEAQADVSRNWAFGRIGVQNAAGKDVGTLAAETMLKAAQAWQNSNKTEQARQALGLDVLGFSLEDLKSLSANPAALAAATARVPRTAAALQPKADDVKAMREFSVALERATQEIEVLFVRVLAPAVPQLREFVNQFVLKFKELIDTGVFDRLGAALEKILRPLVTWVTGPDFDADLRKFATNIGIAADQLGKFIELMGWNQKPNPELGPGAVIKNAKKKAIDDPLSALTAPFKFGEGLGQKLGKNFESLLDSIFHVESASGKNVIGPKTRYGTSALGPFQFMSPTAKQYGVQNPFDYNQSRAGAGAYLSHLLKKYGGDEAKAVAAYNWGEGNLDEDIKAHKDDWLAHAPLETRNYVAKIARDQAAIGQRSADQSGQDAGGASKVPTKTAPIRANVTSTVKISSMVGNDFNINAHSAVTQNA